MIGCYDIPSWVVTYAVIVGITWMLVDIVKTIQVVKLRNKMKKEMENLESKQDPDKGLYVKGIDPY